SPTGLPPLQHIVSNLLPVPHCHAPYIYDIETDAAATQYDYGVDDPSLLPKQPDVGAQEPDATVDNDYYYSRGAYYYVQPADDDQEKFRRIPGRRPTPLSICIPVCASLLKANLFNLCLYSDIVASADSS
uniref:Uncharacterized protein n=1 Tax=Triticum urartu TaxID=4572 RepID=A0A8R7Q1E6_TRIUA